MPTRALRSERRISSFIVIRSIVGGEQLRVDQVSLDRRGSLQADKPRRETGAYGNETWTQELRIGSCGRPLGERVAISRATAATRRWKKLIAWLGDREWIRATEATNGDANGYHPQFDPTRSLGQNACLNTSS